MVEKRNNRLKRERGVRPHSNTIASTQPVFQEAVSLDFWFFTPSVSFFISQICQTHICTISIISLCNLVLYQVGLLTSLTKLAISLLYISFTDIPEAWPENNSLLLCQITEACLLSPRVRSPF